MDEAVRAEYEAILAEVVIERGALVKIHPNQFSWQASDVYQDRPHREECRVVKHGRPVESEWVEFNGTFADPPTEQHHGVDLPDVRCACGRWEGRKLRLEMPVQELADEMFTRLAKKMQKG